MHHKEEKGSGIEALKVVLPHLAKHNEGHIQDASKWQKQAEQAGLKDIAAELKIIVELSEKIHEHLETAIKKLSS